MACYSEQKHEATQTTIWQQSNTTDNYYK